MGNPKKVLFVMFNDLHDGEPSGSTRRPEKMLEAFQELDVDITVLSGLQNRVFERTKRVRKVIQQIKRGESFDYCYIEPPSGPFFCPADLSLIRLLGKHSIPTGIFYRDAFWLFPDLFSTGNPIKNKIIEKMAKRDLKAIYANSSIIYYPGVSFLNLVHEAMKKINPLLTVEEKTLPPGCTEHTLTPESTGIPTAIYVGAAHDKAGVSMMLDSFDMFNEGDRRCNLIFVCPENQLKSMCEKTQRDVQSIDWLQVVHTSDEDVLATLYSKANFALLPRPRSRYNDVAVPVKLYEYISHLKPVLATNCTQPEQIIETLGIGIAVPDNPSDYCKGLEFMCEHYSDNSFVEKLQTARAANTWKNRVQQVHRDLAN